MFRTERQITRFSHKPYIPLDSFTISLHSPHRMHIASEIDQWITVGIHNGNISPQCIGTLIEYTRPVGIPSLYLIYI